MSLSVLPPPTDKETFGKVGSRIIEAAHRLGMEVEPEGMLHAWASDVVKILVEFDQEDNIIGLAFMAVGQRWIDSKIQASLIDFRDPSGQLFSFARTIAQAFNAEGLFYEDPEPLLIEDKWEEYRMIREVLK